MTVPLRAALYLRVSTARQAEHDVSIPDQKRQGEAYCASRGYQLVETYVEPGASATNDRRPEFQRMIEAGTSKPAPFDVVVVHSASAASSATTSNSSSTSASSPRTASSWSPSPRRWATIPMHVMMRQIMALFDEYQSKENAKHVLRALKENARQGFWNGSLPPIGYRVVAAEQRGAKVKKKLEIDPLHADTVRLIYRLALEGDGTSGPMGVKNIATHLNARRIFTRDGGRWGIGQVHRILTRTTYVGRHEFNKRSQEQGAEAGQRDRHGRGAAADRPGDVRRRAGASARPQPEGHAGARRQRPDPPYRHLLLRRLRRRDDAQDRQGWAVSLLHLLDQGAAGRDRLQGPLDPDGEAGQPRCRSISRTGCSSRERLEEVLASVLDRRQERAERRREHIAELNKRAAEADLRLKRLYDAIEAGVADLDDPALKERIAGLKAIRDQAQADAERAAAMLKAQASRPITPQMVRKFARTARERMRIDGGGYRRDHLRALAQRVEVADREVRIMGSKSNLLQTLAAASGVKSATPGVRSSVLNWRRGWDSNP